LGNSAKDFKAVLDIETKSTTNDGLYFFFKPFLLFELIKKFKTYNTNYIIISIKLKTPEQTSFNSFPV
jgi:hypothetical protein